MMDSAGPKRRLATIMAADVVGYSKMMAQDEDATVRTLHAHRQIFDKFIGRHDGRIFNTGGDSVFAEFGSTVEAVRCAITIQDELRVRNAELVPGRQMQFRIGINVGDVLVDGDDLLGDGINVAARLESIASPGGICISGSTFEQVKNKLSVGFENLGPQHVKNIPEPVPAFGIAAAPVSVLHDTDTNQTKAKVEPRRRAIIATVAGVAVLVIAGGVAAWLLENAGSELVPLSSFPENVSTTDMRADQIKSFVTGMTIKGHRAIDDKPFQIAINKNKTVRYEFALAGSLDNGPTNVVIGTWRAEDFHFCMRMNLFAFGREICPTIVKTGSKISARRPNGDPLPWSISRSMQAPN